VKDLQVSFPDRIITNKSRLKHFTTDESFHEGPLPDALFQPHSTAEVVEIVNACASNKVPLIPYGAGTSLEGHTLALHGGIILDMTAMSEIIEVNSEDQDCRCQPGVTREKLNSYLRDTGLTFPIDPGADATIGGMVATSASGTNAVRYGTMKENVLALEAVLADGSVIRTGRRARKTAAGLDLTHLLIGSEGTLGIITEVSLRLHGIPEKIKSLSCSFPTTAAAIDAVIVIIQLGIHVAKIEFLDEKQVNACNQYCAANELEEPTLFIELHGNETETQDQTLRITEIIEELGGRHFRWAETQQQRNVLWRYRYDALPAAKALRPGCEVLITDVCVPISRLSECVVRCQERIEAGGMIAPIVGHVGDGNFHAFFVVNTEDERELAAVRETVEWMTSLAIEMDGTATGEHGIGIGKQDPLIQELGVSAVQAMCRIKKAMDPLGILNPGKIYSPEVMMLR